MNLAKSIHETAMEYSFYAKMAKAKGKLIEEKKAYVIAFFLEKNAILNVQEEDLKSKFILMRSAAALAYHAGLYEESKELITKCRAANPPAYILTELAEIELLVQAAKKTDTVQERLQLEGVLTDVNTKEHEITLNNTANQQVFSIFIPPALLREIVQGYWTKKVQIQARVTVQGLIVLEKIRVAA